MLTIGIDVLPPRKPARDTRSNQHRPAIDFIPARVCLLHKAGTAGTCPFYPPGAPFFKACAAAASAVDRNSLSTARPELRPEPPPGFKRVLLRGPALAPARSRLLRSPEPWAGRFRRQAPDP